MTVRINDSVYPYALKRFFSDNLGHALYLDFYQGTQPTKAAFEAADIYKDDLTGWIDPAKLNTFVTAGSTVVRRWRLTSFSQDILPQSVTELRYAFSNRTSSEYLITQDAENIAVAGTISWFMIRSANTANDTVHYFFTGGITDVNGTGDLRLLRTTLAANDFVIPNDMHIDLGTLSSA